MHKFSGARLRELMAEKGLRSEAVAYHSGLSYRQVEKMRRDGASPTARTVSLIAGALGVTPGELFADDGQSAAIPPSAGTAPPPPLTEGTAAQVGALLDMRGE
jgi:transcriptional regulator with XRE-family HTH domain